jgi:methionine-rich copper-binding protein CopC
MKRFLAAAGAACVTLLILAGTALGHAELVSAEPADGSTVEGPSVSVVLTYDEPLAEGSAATLRGPSGPEVILSIDPADPTRITSGPDPLTVEPGAYAIQWTSVGADGDIERGTVQFTVTAPPPKPTETPTAAPSPTATPAPGDAGSGNTSDGILPIVVGLIVVALVAWWLLRRGSTST